MLTRIHGKDLNVLTGTVTIWNNINNSFDGSNAYFHVEQIRKVNNTSFIQKVVKWSAPPPLYCTKINS